MRMEKKAKDVRVGDWIVGVGRTRSAEFEAETQHYIFNVSIGEIVKVYKDSGVLVDMEM